MDTRSHPFPEQSSSQVPANYQLDFLSTPMGSTITDSGVSFKVWAPNADAVSVIGSFNDWNKESFPLKREGEFWFGEWTGARESDEYLYQITNGDQELSRIDPYAREVTNSVGNSIVFDTDFDWGDSNYRLPSHHEIVIYELHVGSFAMSIPGQPATFDKLIEHISYFQDLGINVIQVMPTAEFAGDISWGYNPAHIFAVEEAYGGPLAFKRFVRAAHEAGIGVILDVVYNHFGPSDLDLWQFDGWSENDKGGIYFYNDHRAETPWGATRPNYGAPEVQNFILNNIRMWIEEYRVDGLRLDMTVFMRTISGNPHDEGDYIPEGWELCQRVNQLAREIKPNILMICEDLQGQEELTQTAEEGGAEFNSQWDKHFVHPIRQILIEPDDKKRDMAHLQHAITHTYNESHTTRVIYTESHDEVANGQQRLASEVDWEAANWFAAKRATLGVSIMMTSPGIPMFFQGQEFLQAGWFNETSPMDWSRVQRFDGIRDMHKDLIALRTNEGGYSEALTMPYCQVLHSNDQAKIILYKRWSDESVPVYVVLNLSQRRYNSYQFNKFLSADIKMLFNSNAKIYRDDFDDTGHVKHLKDKIDVAIGAYSCLIFTEQQ